MIKVRLDIVLLIAIFILMLGILVTLIIIASRLNKNNQQVNQSPVYIPIMQPQSAHQIIQPTACAPQTNIQSDFFRRSMLQAEEVVKGNIKADNYVTGNGSEIINSFLLLNPSEKQKLLQTINFYQSDPIILSESETEFRKISVQQRLPVWLVILSESMKKNNINNDSVLRIMSA